jgi:hypothetical protein
VGMVGDTEGASVDETSVRDIKATTSKSADSMTDI